METMTEKANLEKAKPIFLKLAALIFLYFALSRVIHLLNIFAFGKKIFFENIYFNLRNYREANLRIIYFIANIIHIAICIVPALGLLLKKNKILQIGITVWTASALWFNRNMFRGMLNLVPESQYPFAVSLRHECANFWIVSCIFFFMSSLLLIAVMVIVQSTVQNQKAKEVMSKIWFLPAVLRILYLLSKFMCLNAYNFFRGSPYSCINICLLFFDEVLWLLLFVFLGFGFASTVKKQKEEFQTIGGTKNETTLLLNSGYISMSKHILLLFLTFGIWQYVWIYRTTKYLNCVEGEEYRNPTNKLLLCMFVPFYFIYWIYASAQRIDKLAKQKGIQSDIGILCLVLAIFVPIIPPILMQDKVNAICTVNQSVQAQVVQPQPVQPQVTQLVADETELLRKYKDLLDSGVITQEEFDAKKKQLLGL